MEGRKFGLATTLGLFLASVGLIVPIAWDRYKSKTDLELQHFSTATLLEADQSLKKLVVTYNGRVITNLSKIDVALVNTGRTAIRASDLIAPPTIRFGPNVSVLEVQRERVSPGNLTFTTTVSSSAIAITFPLLNPGDYIRLGIIVSGTPTSFSADARVVGVQTLHFVEKQQQVVERRSSKWSLLVVAFFTVICIVATLALLGELRKDHRLRARLQKGGVLPAETADKAEYALFVDRELGYRPRSERLSFTTLLSNIPNGPLPPEARVAFEALVDHTLTNNSARGAVFISATLSLIGLYFIATNLP